MLSGQIINISTGKKTALEDVVSIIIRLTNTKVVPDIGNFTRREGEVLSLVGNSIKAEKLLNWKARYSLEEGLTKTIAWVKEHD
jgi:nucleoside-diphosphate-sugar epimerase